ncbi:MAG: hypothetical protein FWG21_03220 [Oscillospiraceae bacterium]|nr:hypothetical protein [Oscillospiraceae bacterium]
MDDNQGYNVAGERPRKKKRVLLRIVIWLVIIAAIVFLTLFLAARIGEFNSIMEMIDWIKDQI